MEGYPKFADQFQIFLDHTDTDILSSNLCMCSGFKGLLTFNRRTISIKINIFALYIIRFYKLLLCHVFV